MGCGEEGRILQGGSARIAYTHFAMAYTHNWIFRSPKLAFFNVRMRQHLSLEDLFLNWPMNHMLDIGNPVSIFLKVLNLL